MLMSLNVLVTPVSQMKRLSSDMDPMAQATAQAADDTLAVAACPNYYDGDMAKNLPGITSPVASAAVDSFCILLCLRASFVSRTSESAAPAITPLASNPYHMCTTSIDTKATHLLH